MVWLSQWMVWFSQCMVWFSQWMVWFSQCTLWCYHVRLHVFLVISHLISTSSTAMFFRWAISSTVSLPEEMIPTPLAIALAVNGWSPVTMMTLIPALRQVATASGTFGLGGSIKDMMPMNRSPSRGKFSDSASNGYPIGNSLVGRTRSANPRTRSPREPRVSYAVWKAAFHSSVNGRSAPDIIMLEHRSRIRSGAPFITMTLRATPSIIVSWIDSWQINHSSCQKFLNVF